MSDPLTEALKDMLFEFEDGMEVKDTQDKLAPDGKAFRPFNFGRYVVSDITDLNLVAKMRSALLHLKRQAKPGDTIYWREKPDFHKDFCNSEVSKITCMVAICEKECVS